MQIRATLLSALVSVVIVLTSSARAAGAPVPQADVETRFESLVTQLEKDDDPAILEFVESLTDAQKSRITNAQVDRLIVLLDKEPWRDTGAAITLGALGRRAERALPDLLRRGLEPDRFPLPTDDNWVGVYSGPPPHGYFLAAFEDIRSDLREHDRTLPDALEHGFDRYLVDAVQAINSEQDTARARAMSNALLDNVLSLPWDRMQPATLDSYIALLEHQDTEVRLDVASGLANLGEQASAALPALRRARDTTPNAPRKDGFSTSTQRAPTTVREEFDNVIADIEQSVAEREPPERYRLDITDNSAAQRFDLVLHSTDDRPLCLTTYEGPGREREDVRGSMHVRIISGDAEFPMRLDDQADVDRIHRIEPRGERRWSIPWSHFGNAKDIERLPERKLIFASGVLVCEPDMEATPTRRASRSTR